MDYNNILGFCFFHVKITFLSIYSMPAVERLRHVTVLSHFLTFKQIRELKAVKYVGGLHNLLY